MYVQGCASDSVTATFPVSGATVWNDLPLHVDDDDMLLLLCN